MSQIRRFFLLVAALSLLFVVLPSAPAGAVFNAAYLTASGLPTIRLEPDSNGGITFYVQTTNGDGRFFTIEPAGGHWELSSLHSLPTGNDLELDSNGYPIVHQQ